MVIRAAKVPGIGRRQHAQRRLALRRPARARRSDGRRNAGGWRCRVILCMICTRATPPSCPMVHRFARSSSLFLSRHAERRRVPPRYIVRSVHNIRRISTRASLGSTRIARRRRWQPSILFSRRKCTWVSKAKLEDSYGTVSIFTTLTLPLEF